MPAADEDIVRDLLHRYADHARPPAFVAGGVVARQRRRDRQRRILAITATGAAIGTAAGVIAVVPGHLSAATAGSGATTGTRHTARLTSDQRVLDSLSTAAARQPDSQGRYAVMHTTGSGVRDTTVLDSRTGNMWSYQKGAGGYPSGSGFSRRYSPTAAQFAAMPTGLAALRTALIAQWNEQTRRARPAAAEPTGPTAVQRRVPVTSSDKVFQQASYLLWNPLVSPGLRAALYRELATVPGVRVSRATRDSIGRPAIEISRTDTSGLPGGASDGITYATYENPATGTVLESTISYPPGSDIVGPGDSHGSKTLLTTTVYLSVTWSRTVPANPYGG